MFWEESPKESGAVQICGEGWEAHKNVALETQIPYLANTNALHRLLKGVFIGFI
jgi:hypothetical protein